MISVVISRSPSSTGRPPAHGRSIGSTLLIPLIVAVLIIIKRSLVYLIVASSSVSTVATIFHHHSTIIRLLLTVHPILEKFEIASGHFQLLARVCTHTASDLSGRGRYVIGACVSSGPELLLSSTWRLRILLRRSPKVLGVPLKTATESGCTLVIVLY